MPLDDNHPLVQQMLAELHRRTEGDSSRSVSMYELGRAIGLDRDAAKETGEALIGSGLAAIVSLSGSIGPTPEGLARIEADAPPAGAAAGVRLGDGPVLDGKARDAVDALTARLKTRLAEGARDFDTLAELAADLRTLDVQLASPRPKTAVVRACLATLRDALAQGGDREGAALVDPLL